MDPRTPPVQQRSTFVSIVAWIFIVLTGFGALIGLMQNIMVQTMFSGQEMQAALNSPEAASEIPAFVRFLFSHFKVYVFLMFATTVFTLVSAIGLLKRKNWARKTFIVILALSIVMLFASLIAQFFFFPNPAELAGDELPREFLLMMRVMQIFFLIFYTGLAALLGWIIKKLLTPAIVLEFQSQ